MDRNQAWRSFERMLEAARKGAAAGRVPVAAVLLEAQDARNGDGVDVTLEGTEVMVLWPAQFPTELRGQILAAAAAGYGAGILRRVEGKATDDQDMDPGPDPTVPEPPPPADEEGPQS